MSAIISFIEKLINIGAAYPKDGFIYYNNSYFHQLITQYYSQCENVQTELTENIKNNNEDFVLWELVTDREDMVWNSPWGKGRPGKHIPCSNVVETYTEKDDLVIHCGGSDLYLHHSCEIAQNCAVSNNESVADIWMYNLAVNINGKKMGKSLGNSKTVKSFLAEHDANILRWHLLSQDFDHDIDFDEGDVRKSELEWKEVFSKVGICKDINLYIADKDYYDSIMSMLADNLRVKDALLTVKSNLINSSKEKLITSAYLLSRLGFILG